MTRFVAVSTCLALGLMAALLPARAALAAADPHAAGTADHGTADAHGAGERSVIPHPREALIPAVTTLVVFAFLLAVLGKFAWGPIAAGLKGREDKIRKDIADAEDARRRAEETLREYNARLATAENSVRDMLTKATADGERLATTIRMQAQREAEEIKERTNRDIEAARDAAVRQVREEAVNLATMMAEKVLRRNLNANDQRDLLQSSLEQLQTIEK